MDISLLSDNAGDMESNQGKLNRAGKSMDMAGDDQLLAGEMSRRETFEVQGLGIKGNGNVKDLFDVNGEQFWHHWVHAGGDMDAYIKENLPNYGLVGALLITTTWSYILSPPQGIDVNSPSGGAFIVLMVIACLLNFILVSVPILWIQSVACLPLPLYTATRSLCRL
jgi:hypothetical protein